MGCAKGTVYGPSRDVPGGTVFIRADCKKLSCPHCGPKKARKYRNAVAGRAGELRLTKFVTLTLDPKKIDPGLDSVSYLRQCWAKFRVYLGRKFGSAIDYISIVELHEGKRRFRRGKVYGDGSNYGKAHLHLLIGQYIDQKWISETWSAIGGGFMVFIETVDVHNIAKYLSKYITKEQMLAVPPSKKRISTSRSIRLFAAKVKSGFVMSLKGILHQWQDITGGEDGDGVVCGHRFDDLGLVSFVFSKTGVINA